MAGTIMGESSLRDYWKNNAKSSNGLGTFNQMYGKIGLDEQAALQGIKANYDDTISDAYKSYNNQINTINSLDVSQGYKDLREQELNNSLQEAYNSYRQSYMNNVSTIVNDANNARLDISNTLDELGKNTNKIRMSTTDYVNYLYETNPDMFKKDTGDDFWYNLLTADVADDEISILLRNSPNKEEVRQKMITDKVNEGEGRLLSQEELDDIIYDEYGNITEKGKEFFDKVLNSGSYSTGKFLDYDSWLLNQSQDEKGDYYGLYDWYNNYNMYDISPDSIQFSGGLPTNAAFTRMALGLESNDRVYSFAERFGGLTQSELDNYFNTYRDKLSELDTAISKYGKDQPDKVISIAKGFVNELRSLAKQFGIEDDLKDENGNNLFDVYDKYINSLKDKKISQGEMAQEFLGMVIPGAITGGVTGAKIGGGVGAAAGIATALGFGIPFESIAVDDMRNQNQKVSQLARTSFNALLQQFVILAQQKQTEASNKK